MFNYNNYNNKLLIKSIICLVYFITITFYNSIFPFTFNFCFKDMCERKMYYLYDFSLSFILSSYMCSCDMITGEWYKKRSFAEKEI